jgi:membrane-associated phospholipid phosphatase
LLLFLWLSMDISLSAQSVNKNLESPYKLSWGVDVPIATAALGIGITYVLLDLETPSLTEGYINSLRRKDVWGMDRDATYNWSEPVGYTSDALMYTSFALPLVLFADEKIRKDYLKIGVIYAETFALIAALTSLTKNLVKRPRPFVYNENVELHFKQERSAQYAFFSGHTSMTAAMCFMTAKIFSDYNKGSKVVPWVWAAAATVPAVTGILRQQSGNHFWTDVLAGYVIGAAIGILVPELHKLKPFAKKERVALDIEF